MDDGRTPDPTAWSDETCRHTLLYLLGYLSGSAWAGDESARRHLDLALDYGEAKELLKEMTP